MDEHLVYLKKTFESHHPEWAKRLGGAKSQAEVEAIQHELRQGLLEKLARITGKSVQELDEVDKTSAQVLKPAQLSSLTSARGGEIKAQIHALLDTNQRLSKMENEDSNYVAATMLFGGITALGPVAAAAFNSSIVEGAVVSAAALIGVEAATVAAVCTIAALVVVLIIIPILYFMEKPANCVAFLINKLSDDEDQTITYKGQYNVHGKPQVVTDNISGGMLGYFGGGFIMSKKRDNALVGCQYGVVYSVNKGPDLAFGMDCPLTGAQGWNNCYCDFDISAQTAAEKTDAFDRLEYTASKGNIDLAIRCNDKGGDTAYYIATVSPHA